jgi:DNA-binding XRE family transcriptional regulator
MHDHFSLSYGPKGPGSVPQQPRTFPHLQTVHKVHQTRSLPRKTDGGPVLPQDISSRFGVRLRELRHERHMTQLRMAVDFGIDRSFISDVERGRKSISLAFLEVMALGFKIDLAELLRGL